MGELILQGKPDVFIVLKRSARSRRLSLRVSGLDGQVSMSIPTWTSDTEALRFAREKEDWIRAQLSGLVAPTVPRIGGVVLFEGNEIPVVSGQGRSVQMDGRQMLVPGPPDRSAARVAAFLKVAARQRLTQASDAYADQLNLTYGRVSIRDTRSRWGSCSSEGNLMYSWRLIMAPPEVLNYVAAHEVAHLQEMNHSAAFWAVVARLYPGYDAPRKWLQLYGQHLHAYRFGD
ncbi:MAG: M48 family metallopeptidase [Marinosulfonomonas sp.]